jgi:lipopolysaccharide export LptBFGC system permease protein LptF
MGSQQRWWRLHSEFWTYDDRGNLAEKIYFTGGFTDKSIFDVQGKVIYAIRYRGKAIMFESVKHYNFKGELVESLYYSADGSLTRKDQYKYDEAGRQIEESSDLYKFGLRKTLTRYELDAYGNWVRQTVERWADGTDITKPVPAEVIQERIISYY